MAQGPFNLFEYDINKLKAAEEFIDNLLANPPAALPAGPGEGAVLGVGQKPPKQTFAREGQTVTIRMLGMPLLTSVERRVLKAAYKQAGWYGVYIKTSLDQTHTKVTLYA